MTPQRGRALRNRAIETGLAADRLAAPITIEPMFVNEVGVSHVDLIFDMTIRDHVLDNGSVPLRDPEAEQVWCVHAYARKRWICWYTIDDPSRFVRLVSHPVAFGALGSANIRLLERIVEDVLRLLQKLTQPVCDWSHARTEAA